MGCIYIRTVLWSCCSLGFKSFQQIVTRLFCNILQHSKRATGLSSLSLYLCQGELEMFQL